MSVMVIEVTATAMTSMRPAIMITTLERRERVRMVFLSRCMKRFCLSSASRSALDTSLASRSTASREIPLSARSRRKSPASWAGKGERPRSSIRPESAPLRTEPLRYQVRTDPTPPPTSARQSQGRSRCGKRKRCPRRAKKAATKASRMLMGI